MLSNPVLPLLAILLPQTLAVPVGSQAHLSPLPTDRAAYEIPSRYTSTLLARRLLARSPTGVLSTIFPSMHDSSDSDPDPDIDIDTSSSAPSSVASTPIGLPDYLADCEDTGDPTLLALSVSTSTRNAVAGSNVSLAISWWDNYVRLTQREPWSPANLPRASLIGYLEEMSEKEVEQGEIENCFTGVHRDSRLWLPGDKSAAHLGRWMRMVVQEVYWIGGFGDRAYIGWFDPEEWRSIRKQDWDMVRLPGEEGNA